MQSGNGKTALTKETDMKTKYIISAHNDQGAYCAGGAAASLTAAVKKARSQFGKGWKIEIWLEDECVKSFVTRQ